jgi:hypothetical protein
MRSLKRKPSPALVVAIMALCVSLVGTAIAVPIATVSLNKKEKKQIRKISGKISNKRITKRAPGLSVASAQAADTARSADSASNANALGGVLASGYVRNGCESPMGQIRGFARVPGDVGFPATFTAVSEAYNCSAGAVQAKRNGVGEYEVRFLDSPVTIAIGNIVNNPATIDSAFVSFTRIGPGHFRVHIYNAVLASTQDRPFSVLTP